MVNFKQAAGAPPLIKGTFLVIVIAVLLTVFSGGALAADRTIEVTLDDVPLEFSNDPYLTEGTTLVQFRPLFEAMNLQVEWNNEEQIVTGTREGLTLIMQINNTQASINGRIIELEQPPRLMGDHTMVPIRFVSESTGSLVEWNPYKPQIVIYTEAYLAELGLTKAQAQEALDKELERIKAEYEASQQPVEPIQPVPVPDPPTGSGEYTPATGSVDLNNLLGMYYGFRDDFGGYECGGICWDLYTFLPGNKIVVGAPPSGGPETIDCVRDQCDTYTISNGHLTLGNGEVHSIGTSEAKLVINNVQLTPVEPVQSDLKLSNSYLYRGYQGLIGISSGSVSWSKTIEFREDGTFQSDSLMLGSVEGGAPTQGAAGSGTSGSYRISGNTIVLAYGDGSAETLLFFIHENDSEDIQIGENNFYVD